MFGLGRSRDNGKKKTLSQKIKYEAFFLVIITFSISASIFRNEVQLQFVLLGIAIVLLFLNLADQRSTTIN